MTLATIVFATLEMNTQVSWAKALCEVIQGLVETSQRKAQGRFSLITYLPSYLAHLYEYDDCLTPGELLIVDWLRPAADVANLNVPHSPETLQNLYLINHLCELLDCEKREIANRVAQLKAGNQARPEPEAAHSPVLDCQLVIYEASQVSKAGSPNRAQEEVVPESFCEESLEEHQREVDKVALPSMVPQNNFIHLSSSSAAKVSESSILVRQRKLRRKCKAVNFDEFESDEPIVISAEQMQKEKEPDQPVRPTRKSRAKTIAKHIRSPTLEISSSDWEPTLPSTDFEKPRVPIEIEAEPFSTVLFVSAHFIADEKIVASPA